jgi:hypothetical protein
VPNGLLEVAFALNEKLLLGRREDAPVPVGPTDVTLLLFVGSPEDAPVPAAPTDVVEFP